jgi:hypothetical protein
VSKTIDLLQAIGSPFGSRAQSLVESEALYQYAFKNRVGLLYLRALKEQNQLQALTQAYEELDRRARETLLTAGRLAQVLADADVPYVLFKTLRPYPATPNDVDVIYLGPDKEFGNAKKALRDAGYLQDDSPAALQGLFVDPRGADVANWDKAGGMYYVDLYQEVSADYFVYVRKSEVRDNVTTVLCGEGISVHVLHPEVELAAIMMHSVFPEITYSLEMFYSICYCFAQTQHPEAERFVSFVKRNHLVRPAIASLSVTLALHQEAFGSQPAVITDLARQLGKLNISEIEKLQANRFRMPHKYSFLTFAGGVTAKLVETRALWSMGVQLLHMLDPRFAFGVFRTLQRKLTRETYVQV